METPKINWANFKGYKAGLPERLAVANRQLALWASDINIGKVKKAEDHLGLFCEVGLWAKECIKLYAELEAVTQTASLQQGRDAIAFGDSIYK